jgi:NAD(P) transhydrogenase
MALFATGRTSNVEGLGLEQLGVRLGDRGLILVNERYQTSVPNIYAAGDVIGFPALVSTSMEQARVAMVHAFDLRYKQRLSSTVPLAVYTIPEIAMVGLTSDECEERGIPHLSGRAYYAQNARGQIIGDMSGMLKIILSPEDKRVLGVHLIGEMASELIHIGADVIASEGTIDEFIHAVYNFPSLSDLYKYAAYDGLDAWHRWRGDDPTR